jgi:hypothetical protein
LVEFTTEVCGLDGGKQTVELTSEEAAEVDALFSSIRERLNETETREEAEEIFKEAVVELDKYGLIGGLSVKQAQRLVTGGYQDSRIMKIMEKFYGKNQADPKNVNILCLVAGESDDSFFVSLTSIIRVLTAFFSLVWIYLYLPVIFPFIIPLQEKIGIDRDRYWGLLALFLSVWWPFNIGKLVSFGRTIDTPWYGKNYVPAEGWVSSYGLFGIKHLIGSFYGQLPKFLRFPAPFGYAYTGAVGFTGIRIAQDLILSYYFLGFALYVKIGENRP